MIFKLIFWILIFVIFYTYFGYGLVLFLLVQLKRISTNKKEKNIGKYEPEVTLLIPAYNEADFVDQKVKNSIELNYPENKIKHVWITDGSTDNTLLTLKKHKQITVLHENERKGKIGAINRVMKYINTPIVIFSDANTILTKISIKEIVKLFSDSKVGCVAGEKTINTIHKDIIHTGEGFYWKLESLIKKWESNLYSAIAAAGEIFAIRTKLFENVEPDIILDDLIISIRIAQKGYLIKYSPEATASENASLNVKEELKRKIRIACGSFQALNKIGNILNPIKYGILSFFFFSHKVIRWTLAPLSLLAIIPVNYFIVSYENVLLTPNFFSIFLLLQFVFYLLSFIGLFLRKKHSTLKLFSIPFYFCIMNYSIYAGFLRFITKKQSVNWEKAKRI